MNKRESVYKQFFEQYLNFFKEILLLSVSLDIPRALYLFTFTDYFGKILYVADKREIDKLNYSKNNFCYLIDEYFNSDYSGLGLKIYEIYRCGVMHTVYPKNCGLEYLQGNTQIEIEREIGIPDQRYKINVLNLWRYEKELANVISKFVEVDLKNLNDDQINNIHALITDDIFGDKSALEKFSSKP